MADIVVTARLENTCDRGVVEQNYSDASAVRATSMEVVVNTATAMLMPPGTVVECLGLEAQQSAMVVNDDGSREIRPIAGPGLYPRHPDYPLLRL